MPIEESVDNNTLEICEWSFLEKNAWRIATEEERKAFLPFSNYMSRYGLKAMAIGTYNMGSLSAIRMQGKAESKKEWQSLDDGERFEATNQLFDIAKQDPTIGDQNFGVNGYVSADFDGSTQSVIGVSPNSCWSQHSPVSTAFLQYDFQKRTAELHKR